MLSRKHTSFHEEANKISIEPQEIITIEQSNRQFSQTSTKTYKTSMKGQKMPKVNGYDVEMLGKLLKLKLMAKNI